MSNKKFKFVQTTKVEKFPGKNYIPPPKKVSEDGDKPHRRFSVAEKLEILKKLDSEKITMTELADRHGVSRAAIYKIKRNRENILKFASNISNRAGIEKKRTSSGFLFYEMLDQIMFDWICQLRQLGQPFNGPYLCDVALHVNRMIGGTSHFKASQGWLSSFKNRHGMKRSKVLGEKLTIDSSKYEEYQEDYTKLNKDQDYKAENIYIGDEASLNWKSLPQKSSAEASGKEKAKTKDKVCILFCANADGSSRLPPLIIGPSRKPRTVRGKNMHPVTYAAQKSSWMEQRIFTDWYKNHFIPFVKNKQKTEDPVLLIIDNCPVHPSIEELNAIDPQFRVVNTLSKVIPVTDLMHRHVIQKTKLMYRKKFLQELISVYKKSNDIEAYLNSFETIDACYMIAAIWQQLSQADLAVTWSMLKRSFELTKKPSKDSCEAKLPDDPFDYDNIGKLKQMAINLPARCNLNHQDIKNWLKDDFFDQGWQPLKLQDIVQRVLAAHKLVAFDEKCEDPLDDKLIAKLKKDIQSREKVAEDSDSPMDVDYIDFATLDDTIDLTKPGLSKSETSDSEKSDPWIRESMSESDTMDYSTDEIQELEDSILNSPTKKSIEDSDVTDCVKSKVDKLMPASSMVSLDENALNAVNTIRRWYKLKADSSETIVRKHLEALENMENYITAYMVSNYSHSVN